MSTSKPASLDLCQRVEQFFERELARAPGFEARLCQKEMALAVARAMTKGSRLTVEAGTGTGKSLAYLVPLLLADSEAGRPMLVATKTLQLQTQLMDSEIPLLQELVPHPKKVVQARGWSNYLCMRKLEYPAREAMALLGDEMSRLQALAKENNGRVLRQDAGLPRQSFDLLKADPLDCEKRRCPYFSRCGLFNDRSKLESADIILTNHAFLVWDVRARRRGNGLLPSCAVLVLDEAHRFDDVATEHLSMRFDFERLDSSIGVLLRQRLETIRGHLLASVPTHCFMDWSRRFDQQVVLGLRLVLDLGLEVLELLGAEGGRFPNAASALGGVKSLFKDGKVVERAGAFLDGLTALVRDLVSFLRDYEEADPLNNHVGLEAVITSIQDLLEESEFIFQEEDVDWVFLCHFSPPAFLARPIESGAILDSELFSGFSAVIATSATLKVNGSFEFFLKRSGLEHVDMEVVKLDSPFDIDASAFIGFAVGGPEPAEKEFGLSLVEPLYELIAGLGGRTLVLATSYTSIREYALSLRNRLLDSGIELLVQGQASPRELLQKFSSKGSYALLGVDTFWEGVDVPGERLSSVVLTRLPFPVPSDPVFSARCNRIEQQGKRSFDELSLPLAALKIKQGFGRLLRRQDDRGVFLVLDPRIASKRYGRVLAGNIPGTQAVWAGASELVIRALQWAREHGVREP